MPHASHPLPSISLVASHSDHYKTRLPNLTYPSRLYTHVPWSGTSAPLVISKTESARYESSFVTGYGSANAENTSGDGFHASFEAHFLSWFRACISRATSAFLRKFNEFREKLAAARLPLL
ncbi:hypothetical protein CVT26_013835 [Gymnopilus dilepis]|uniref:Uncharacterized protein n=1 Tax=Gymnopilus dilepis TaxID=231916 RepID=A0A409VVZ7_9AGAR|nr:hypothetical protein CVT26_013835 [Gymnopilus dilepis]